jgi:protocatechuate 3,4-dioxygenase beta subunit
MDQPGRRAFLVGGTAALVWARCGGDRESRRDAAPPGPDGTPGACSATEANIEGPFYKQGAPSRMVLVGEDTPGARLALAGRVLGGPSCQPLAGATVDVWQADAEGAYDTGGFELRGVLESADDGGYEVFTIVPGHYLNGAQYRPAHIHVKVSAPGHQQLTTQLYFAGDPYNDIDPFIRESLIMSPSEQEDGSLSATFDLVLAPA